MSQPTADTFVCEGCKCELTADYSLRTPGYCLLCDPAITLEELLSDQPIQRTANAELHDQN